MLQTSAGIALDAFVIVAIAPQSSNPDSASLGMSAPTPFPGSRICDFPSPGISEKI
ncbi:hypothetical protein LC653_25185 [Nostoc sp. CHAB 5784]|uniref:hypothetical protein n=1 Tax=Nostoc mirabile TaxID=2907820 RepID=UPI001E600613|nr:hypothetical protein [Nostoc mirabile]MCC5667091.1 hypothetical protein [Nostoc mirabile CHAB5784]